MLDPIARRYHADLYLPSGEISDTQMHTMAKSAAEDGRPFVMFTFADFDPSGNHMTVSISRKLQAFREGMFPGLEFEVYPVALTADQAKEFDLPHEPIKPGEKRGEAWETYWGRGQTEIDALATLRPDNLTKIAVDAISPFFDESLAWRVNRATMDWETDAQESLDDQYDDALTDDIYREFTALVDGIQPEIDRLNERLQLSASDVFDGPPLPELPEADLTESHRKPLISSAWDWVQQTLSVLKRKAYLTAATASLA